jgi:septal ring factor EnvC (AmiA/AmiB activator)
LNSRPNVVERKIRELAEKDPEVKRKLAEYDAAIARRKQKLEKRKANKAEARTKREASECTTESYYVPFEPEVDIVF